MVTSTRRLSVGLVGSGRPGRFHLQRLSLLLALRDEVQCAVEDFLGRTLLAVAHQAVDELAHQHIAVLGIGKNLALLRLASSGQVALLVLLGAVL